MADRKWPLGVSVSPGSCCLSTDGLDVRIRTRSDRQKVKMGEKASRGRGQGRLDSWWSTVGKKEGGRTHLEVAIKRGPGYPGVLGGPGGATAARNHWPEATDYGRR